MKWLRMYSLSLVLTVVIGLLLLLPMPATSAPRFPNEDKYIHAVLFLGLTLSLYWEFFRSYRSTSSPRPQASHASMLLSAVLLLWPLIWGGILELLQQYCTTYRTGSWWDWVADGIGVFMGVALALVWFFPKTE